MLWFVLGLLACEAGVTFDDVATDVAEGPEGSSRGLAPTVPADGRPEREAEEVRLAAARAAARANQPAMVRVPEGQRERAWDWDFEVKGPTRTQRLRANPTLEEGLAIEAELAAREGRVVELD